MINPFLEKRGKGWSTTLRYKDRYIYIKYGYINRYLDWPFFLSLWSEEFVSTKIDATGSVYLLIIWLVFSSSRYPLSSVGGNTFVTQCHTFALLLDHTNFILTQQENQRNQNKRWLVIDSMQTLLRALGNEVDIFEPLSKFLLLWEWRVLILYDSEYSCLSILSMKQQWAILQALYWLSE